MHVQMEQPCWHQTPRLPLPQWHLHQECHLPLLPQVHMAAGAVPLPLQQVLFGAVHLWGQDGTVLVTRQTPQFRLGPETHPCEACGLPAWTPLQNNMLHLQICCCSKHLIKTCHKVYAYRWMSGVQLPKETRPVTCHT